MSNADQLKYLRMKETLDKKPTPLRRRASDPQAIRPVPRAPLDKLLSLRELSKILFTIGHYDDYEPAIVEMTQDEFDIFMVRVLEDDE